MCRACQRRAMTMAALLPDRRPAAFLYTLPSGPAARAAVAIGHVAVTIGLTLTGELDVLVGPTPEDAADALPALGATPEHATHADVLPAQGTTPEAATQAGAPAGLRATPADATRDGAPAAPGTTPEDTAEASARAGLRATPDNADQADALAALGGAPDDVDQAGALAALGGAPENAGRAGALAALGGAPENENAEQARVLAGRRVTSVDATRAGGLGGVPEDGDRAGALSGLGGAAEDATRAGALAALRAVAKGLMVRELGSATPSVSASAGHLFTQRHHDFRAPDTVTFAGDCAVDFTQHHDGVAITVRGQVGYLLEVTAQRPPSAAASRGWFRRHEKELASIGLVLLVAVPVTPTCLNRA